MGYAFFVLMLFAALLLLIFHGAAADSAAEGLRLFCGSVLPCLFPFMVCGKYFAEFLGGRSFSGKKAHTRFSRVRAALSTLPEALVCAVCGLPSAAVICGKKSGAGLSARHASALCAALNQVNPLFIIGLASAELLKAPGLWPLLAAAHYLPALLLAVLLSALGAEADLKPIPAVDAGAVKSPLALFGSAVSGASVAALRICGTMVFFKVMLSALGAAGLERVIGGKGFALFSGVLEMTNGLYAVVALPLEPRLCAAVVSFFMSFGGLCVFIQSALFFEELKPLPYFAAKLLTGALSFGICYLFFPVEAAAVMAQQGGSLAEAGGAAFERGVTLLYSSLSFALAACVSYLYSRLFVKKRTV